MPRITQYYGIPDDTVPFLDVEVTIDNRMFIDPHAIRLAPGPEPFVTAANTCTTSFFEEVARCALAPAGSSERVHGRTLLEQFGEPRETRLGMARHSFDGHGGAETVGSWIWGALTTDLDVLIRVGILGQLEAIPLFIHGIDRDITSDLTTRIIFGPLAAFTAHMVDTYPQFRVAGQRVVAVNRQTWDPATSTWVVRSVELPTVDGQPLLLVPRDWARSTLLMSGGRYYDTSVLTYAQMERAVVLQGRLVKSPKDKLRLQPDLGRGRATNLRVTLRAQAREDDLVARFREFVDERARSNRDRPEEAA